MTFTDLAAEWLTRKGHLDASTRQRYQYAVTGFAGCVPDMTDPDFPQAVTRWQSLRRAGLSPSTFNMELSVIKQVFDYAVLIGKLPTSPVADLRPTKFVRRDKPVPTEEQFASLIAELRRAGGRDAADFAEFLAYSGCRQEEARLLAWQDVDFDANRMLVGRDGIAKNGAENYVPLFPKLRALLELRRAKTLPDPTALVWGDVQLLYRLRRACKVLGLPEYHHHTLRHYFAVQALRRLGINKAPVVAKWLNHRDGGKLLLELYANHVTDDESQALAGEM